MLSAQRGAQPGREHPNEPAADKGDGTSDELPAVHDAAVGQIGGEQRRRPIEFERRFQAHLPDGNDEKQDQVIGRKEPTDDGTEPGQDKGDTGDNAKRVHEISVRPISICAQIPLAVL